MDSSDNAPQSLRDLFDSAESKRQAIESSYDTTSPSYAAQVEEAGSLYTTVLAQISAVSLFSPNEGVEDIATSELPFLLTSFRLAELVQRTPRLPPRERIALLRRARLAYDAFLNLVDAYGLVTPPYDKLLERYRDEGERFALVASGADAAAKRNGKIASFKAEKLLKDKLEALRRNPRYAQTGDEELVREVHLANLAFCIHTTFNSLDSLNRELDLLAQAPPDPSVPADNNTVANDARHHQREEAFDPTLRLDGPLRQGIGNTGPLLSKNGKPLQPFTLLGSNARSEMARGVFRPGHNLPTMSIDEYLEEERRRGNIIEGGEQPRPVVDEDDMEVADRATYKARDWDDFKDDNPRGSGNTMNMG